MLQPSTEGPDCVFFYLTAYRCLAQQRLDIRTECLGIDRLTCVQAAFRLEELIEGHTEAVLEGAELLGALPLDNAAHALSIVTALVRGTKQQPEVLCVHAC